MAIQPPIRGDGDDDLDWHESDWMGYPVDRLSQHQWMYRAPRQHATLGGWVAHRRRSGWGLHGNRTRKGHVSGGRISCIPAADQSEPLAGGWIACRNYPTLEHSFGPCRLETGASKTLLPCLD